jgi:hypothetical protein
VAKPTLPPTKNGSKTNGRAPTNGKKAPAKGTTNGKSVSDEVEDAPAPKAHPRSRSKRTRKAR